MSGLGWAFTLRAWWWGPGWHAALMAELAEWWEDLWQARTGSRVLLVKVPPGWGVTDGAGPLPGPDHLWGF